MKYILTYQKKFLSLSLTCHDITLIFSLTFFGLSEFFSKLSISLGFPGP